MFITYTLCAVLLIASLWFFSKVLTRQTQAKRHAYIDSYVFPKRLSETLIKTYPHLTEPQVVSIIYALRDYFHLCLNAGRKRSVAMPSQAVDVAWHEFILFTHDYEKFCHQSFGHFLHHTPAEAMSSRMRAQTGIKNAWKLACERANIDPHSPAYLPSLFAVDDMYDIPDGFRYSLNCNHAHDLSTSNKKVSNLPFCATHIGCGSGCSTGCSGAFSLFGDGDSGDSGSCSSCSSCGSGCGSGCGS